MQATCCRAIGCRTYVFCCAHVRGRMLPPSCAQRTFVCSEALPPKFRHVHRPVHVVLLPGIFHNRLCVKKCIKHSSAAVDGGRQQNASRLRIT